MTINKTTAVVSHIGNEETLNRSQLITVLQTSLYPGAKVDSVGLVLDYCVAAGLDPLQKPVHIVPMNVRDAQSGNYEWRDIIMPGIGLYRIQADRSGTYAGLSAPQFGPDITRTFKNKGGANVEHTFPEWCEVTAYKLMKDGSRSEFTVREYWLENYATDSGKSSAPNAMWLKRPRGQIAKCAEAQALRKGWPEVGQSPTAEEMEGKTIDMGDLEVGADGVAGQKNVGETVQRKSNKQSTSDKPKADAGVVIDNESGEVQEQSSSTVAGSSTAKPGAATLNPNMIKIIRVNLKKVGMEETDLCLLFNVGCLEEIAATEINKVLESIKAPQ